MVCIKVLCAKFSEDNLIILFFFVSCLRIYLIVLRNQVIIP